MKLEFDVKVTEKDLYSFNIEQAYKGSQGVISLLFAVLLAFFRLMKVRGMLFYPTNL